MYQLYVVISMVTIFSMKPLYSAVVSHQAYLYISSSYNNLYLDQVTNIYDMFSQSAGIGYKADVFLSRRSRHFFSFGINTGFGIIIPNLRGSLKTINYNTFFEAQGGVYYGYLFGKERNHKVYFIGALLQPKFFGLFEKNKFTQIGSTEIDWFKGFYIPLSVGLVLPSYNYIKNNFFVGFSHNLNFLVYGHSNINVPQSNRILMNIGYQLSLEAGYSFDPMYSYKYSSNFNEPEEEFVRYVFETNTYYVAETNTYYISETKVSISSNNNAITISIFISIEDENVKTISVEMFAIKNKNDNRIKKNLIARVSSIPVINKSAQYTRHWRYKVNLSGESININPEYVAIRYKEMGDDKKIISEKEIVESIRGGNK